MPLGQGPTRRTRLFQSHAAAAIVAARVFADQFDTGAIQCVDDPGQRFDDTADVADARLHPLDRRQRNPGQFGQRPLVNAQQRSRRFHLKAVIMRPFHVERGINDISYIYNDLKNIIWQAKPAENQGSTLHSNRLRHDGIGSVLVQAMPGTEPPRRSIAHQLPSRLAQATPRRPGAK
jgi:hypothetical protein